MGAVRNVEPMNVIIASPYATDSLNGNTVTSLRIARLLEGAGHSVQIMQSSEISAESVKTNDAMIALHAKKSAGAAQTYYENHPDGKLIVFLTGTDLYEDLPNGCPECLATMDSADALVVSQSASLDSIPEEFISKAHVVYKSIVMPELAADVEFDANLFTVVGHLRAVKQPFMIVEAMKLLGESVRVKSLGGEFDAGSAEIANAYSQNDARYEWLGECDYVEALSWMQRSVATVNTSLSEGGANSVGESIMLGVPVLASRIEGNVGMLGDSYSGYFAVDQPSELASLMLRVMEDEKFLNQLKTEILERQGHFVAERELEGWLNLLKN